MSSERDQVRKILRHDHPLNSTKGAPASLIVPPPAVLVAVDGGRLQARRPSQALPDHADMPAFANIQPGDPAPLGQGSEQRWRTHRIETIRATNGAMKET